MDYYFPGLKLPSPIQQQFSLSLGPPSLGLSKLQGLQHIEKETKEAKEEFSRIAEDEKKRVQQVVDVEKERILQERRTHDTVQICPLCLDEIDPMLSSEERKRGGAMMMCCNVTHCSNCAPDSIEYMYKDESKNGKCFNCREPLRTPILWVKTITHDDKRHWLLSAIGHFYVIGAHGLTKNTKKGIKLLQRAAEMGNAEAQSKLAAMYQAGEIVPKCLEKARYYAEKAANHGLPDAQALLAIILLSSDNNREGAFRLLTLAAYQGSHPSCYTLGRYYDEENKDLIPGHEDWKKNALLSLYWLGKISEIELKDPMDCGETHAKMESCRNGGARKLSHPRPQDPMAYESLVRMAFCLDTAMRKCWHPRPHLTLDALPGCSHVPFFTWALAKGEQHAKELMLNDPDLNDHPWENVCAHCGTNKQETQQFKTCARCKAFFYCSKKCQVEHWKDGHKVDCKGHWIEDFFPEIKRHKRRSKT